MDWRGRIAVLEAEREVLRAEVERLRGLIVALVPPPPPERARAVMRALITEATAIIDARRALAPEEKP
jgi:hypothetical protein